MGAEEDVASRLGDINHSYSLLDSAPEQDRRAYFFTLGCWIKTLLSAQYSQMFSNWQKQKHVSGFRLFLHHVQTQIMSLFNWYRTATFPVSFLWAMRVAGIHIHIQTTLCDEQIMSQMMKKKKYCIRETLPVTISISVVNEEMRCTCCGDIETLHFLNLS